MSLFYFSIETLATVGYGDMHPQTNYGHLVATIEIFTGMCLLAVMTGLIFARFSRPRARFIFAEHPVVTVQQGEPTLMIRVANARNNTISQATARLWLFRLERMAEGHQLRRYHELKLDRSEHPMFSLSWTLFHAIDETSPLYGLTEHDLAAVEARFGAQCQRCRRQFGPAAPCAAALLVSRHPLEPPLPGHHQPVGGRPDVDRLQPVPRGHARRRVRGEDDQVLKLPDRSVKSHPFD